MNVQSPLPNQNEINSGSNSSTPAAVSSTPSPRPILSRAPASASVPVNGRVLPLVYVKMPQKEGSPVVCRPGTIISTLGPKFSSAPSSSQTLSVNEPGFVTIQAALRSAAPTSVTNAALATSQAQFVAVPKVQNPTLTLSNQQFVTIQSSPSTNQQAGVAPQQQFVTIQAPIVSKTQANSGVVTAGQGQPQYVTIRTPVLTSTAGGVTSGAQGQYVTIQAPVVQTGLSSGATFMPVSTVGAPNTSGKSPIAYQVLKTPVPMANIVPASQSKMVFTPVSVMPKAIVSNVSSVSVPSTSVTTAVNIVASKPSGVLPVSTRVISNSTLSLLQQKQSQSLLKEQTQSTIEVDSLQPKASSILLPAGVSVANTAGTNSLSQGFINLTIANGHIQPSVGKDTSNPNTPTQPSEVGGGKVPQESPTLPAVSDVNVSSTNLSSIDMMIVRKDAADSQSADRDVIDINSILKSSNSICSQNKEEGEKGSNCLSEQSKNVVDPVNNISAGVSEASGATEAPPRTVSPISLYCDEDDITLIKLSPTNDPPAPKYTIRMPEHPDDDIKIELVRSDEPAPEKAEKSQPAASPPQIGDSSSLQQSPPIKPLPTKTSPKLLSKGTGARKSLGMQSILLKNSKPPVAKINVKSSSILKPQLSKQRQDKKEIESGTGTDSSPGTPKVASDIDLKPVKPSTPDSTSALVPDDFDAIGALEWKNGIGHLPGSNLKFRLNEFGLMEMVSDEDEKLEKERKLLDTEPNSPDTENLLLDDGSNSSADMKPSLDGLKDKKDAAPDDVFCCEICGVYGLASEFLSSRFCTQACSAAFTVKKAWQYKREQDLRALRLRRKKRRLEQQKQAREKAEQDEMQKDVKPDVKKLKLEISEEMSDLDDGMEEMNASQSSSHSTSSIAGVAGKVTNPCHVMSAEEDLTAVPDVNETAKRSRSQKTTLNFTWSKYLDMVKAKAAPPKLFKDPFPFNKNGFKIGMKLEGIDPEHPAHFCVLSVAEVKGYRLRIHFDGYPENYDFWVNADSPEIFQVGWCEKNLRQLTPPKGLTQNPFNWNTYLKQCKATAAPRYLFSKSSASPVCPNGFRLGMKLEAVDRKNSSLICVATVADILDNRILVHFDSWDEMYDYWTDPSSPYIHPVGWCEEHGHPLTPPNQYKDASLFSWERYLKETKTFAAPARAFKLRQPCGFRRGMRIEAVDKRVPHLIRVATVSDVHDHRIRISFDGWPDEYSYWVDDDSPDIHPPGWCRDTKHPLEPPLSEEDMQSLAKCGIEGCKGEGHIKGPKFSTHNSALNCPYAPENMNKEGHLLDRLAGCNESPLSDESPNKEKKVQGEKTDQRKCQGRVPKWKRLLRGDDDNQPKKPRMSDDDDESIEKPSLIISMQQKLQSELERSVIDPGYQIETGPGRPPCWAKHSQPLQSSPIINNATNPMSWTGQEVTDLLSSIHSLQQYAKTFSEQDVDGEALLLLTQNELISNMGLKLGHAITLYNCIVLLRQKCT